MVLASLVWLAAAMIVLAIFGYRGGLDYVDARLDDLRHSAPPSFAKAYFDDNREQLDLMLEAVSRLPEVTYVEVGPLEGMPGQSYLLGDKNLPHDFRQSYPLNPSDPNSPVLSIAVSQASMRSGLFGYLLLALGAAVLGILLIGVFVMNIFNQTVTRHLEQIADFMVDLEAVNIDRPLMLDRKPAKNPNEIDVLVDSINEMRKGLSLAIEERDLANRVLEEAEQAHGTLLSNLPGMVYRCLNNEKWDTTFLSDGCRALTGYEPEVFVSGRMGLGDIIHPEDQEMVWKQVQRGIVEKRPYRIDYRIVRKDGKHLWVLEQGEAVYDESGEVLVLEGFISDFTSRRQSEESLRESESRFRTLANLSPIGIFMANLEGACLYVNEHWTQQVGMSAEEAMGHGWVRSIHSDDMAAAQEAWDRGAASGAKWTNEFRIVTPDDETKWIMSHAEGLRDSEGNITGYICASADITKRKLAEDALRASERAQRSQAELLQTLLNTIPNPVFYKDSEGRFLGCNEEFANKIIGLPASEIMGKRLMELAYDLPPELGELYHQADLDLIANPGEQQFENEVRCADGKQRHFYFSRATFHVSKGPAAGIIGIMVDLTERKELEEQLGRSQKMEAIGRLAGGIAHDFNNLLQVIRNNIELVLADPLDAEQTSEDLSDAITAVDRASSLTRQLLTYGRRQALEVQEIRLDRQLAEMMGMLRRIIREDITLELNADDDLWNILGDPVQLEQVFMNLCVNASDAMPRGGFLNLSLENLVFDEESSPSAELEAGRRHVKLSVEDSGSGMDEKTLERIFDPFFSTKDVGEGTGLGLSTAMGIVRQHGGVMEVSRVPGKGTCFDIYFPARSSAPSEYREPLKVETVGGSETLLLAEDDDSVRKLTARTLERAGYRVITATDGRDAVNLFRKHADEIDLVLLDMVMPVLGGRDAVNEMRDLRPDLRHLFISGYDPGESGGNGGGLELLSKPYAPSQLLGKIRQLLDR